jgi:hypothetical protein
MMRLKYPEQGGENMRNAKNLRLVCLFAFLFMCCDASGNLFLTNGYSQDVILYATYNYQGEIIENSLKFRHGMVFPPAAMGHIEYNYIIALKLEDSTGTVLAEYDLDYLMGIRNAYVKTKGKSQRESWIFTEKGLFFKTREIERKYKFDTERIREYYRSDEAVRDLEAMLVKNEKIQ